MESPKSPALPKDFPDWLGPVLVKELRRGTRRGWFVTVFILAQVAMVGAIVLDSRPEFWMDGDIRFVLRLITKEASFAHETGFWMVAASILWLGVPLLGTNALRVERDGGNVELLLLAGLTRWRIVLGVWMGLGLMSLLLLMSFVPYLLARYFLFGGMDLPRALGLFLLLAVGSLTANAFIVGLSGYRSPLKRLIVAGLALPALFFTWVIALVSVGYVVHLLKLDSMFDRLDSMLSMVTFMGVPAAAVCGFTVSAFLQLGRAKLRLFDPRNWEARPSRACLVGVILSPLIFGFLGLCTAGFGTIPALVFGAFINFRADRKPQAEDLLADGGYL